MKRLSIATFGFLFVLMSCQKEDIVNQITDESEDVSTFLKMSASASSSSTDSLHHKRKHHVKITEIDIANLSATITNYISTNYAGATINKAGTDSLGNYYIKVIKADSSYTCLLFDASGNFVKVLLKGHRGNRGRDIAITTLPTVIRDYVSTNYAGSIVHRAILDNDGSYKLIVVQTDGSFIGLAFDKDGNFISTITVKDKHGRKKRRK